jgi:hypothetical protein
MVLGTRLTAGGDVGVRLDCGRKFCVCYHDTQLVAYGSLMVPISSFISSALTLPEDKVLKQSDAPREG